MVYQISKLAIFFPYVTSSTAVDIVKLFLNHVMCKFGMLKKIVCNCDTRFMSEFWITLMAKLDIKLVCSLYIFHRPIDSLRDCTNWLNRFYGAL